jgi:hypothetical protein
MSRLHLVKNGVGDLPADYHPELRCDGLWTYRRPLSWRRRLEDCVDGLIDYCAEKARAAIAKATA